MIHDPKSFPNAAGADEVPELGAREQLEFEVSQLIDGTLAADRRPAVEAALSQDPQLSDLHDALRQAHVLLHRQPDLDAIDLSAMADGVMAAVRADEEAPVVLKLPAASTAVSPRAWWITLSAAAAALVVGLGMGALLMTSQSQPSLIVERGHLETREPGPVLAAGEPQIEVAGPGSLLQQQRAAQTGAGPVAMSVAGPDVHLWLDPAAENGLPEFYAIYTGNVVIDVPSEAVVASAASSD